MPFHLFFFIVLGGFDLHFSPGKTLIKYEQTTREKLSDVFNVKHFLLTLDLVMSQQLKTLKTLNTMQWKGNQSDLIVKKQITGWDFQFDLPNQLVSCIWPIRSKGRTEWAQVLNPEGRHMRWWLKMTHWNKNNSRQEWFLPPTDLICELLSFNTGIKCKIKTMEQPCESDSKRRNQLEFFQHSITLGPILKKIIFKSDRKTDIDLIAKKWNYVTRFGKSLSTCSLLACGSVWHSTQLRAKTPKSAFSPYAHNRINHLLHCRFLLCPFCQTAGSGPQPLGSSLREVWHSQWSEWIRVMCDMQRRGSRMWQQLSFKVKLFLPEGRGIDDKDTEVCCEKSQLLLLAL